MRRNAGRALLWGFLLVLALPGAAQEPEENPVTEAELISWVNAERPEEEMIAEVRERGVAFQKLTPETVEGLKKLELEKLLAAIREPAAVELQANAPGASVTLDGEAREPLSPEGQTVLADLTPGPHVIRVNHEDYVSQSVDVFVKPGETRRIEVELKPAVTTTPGPLGTDVSVAAGTKIDNALVELEFAEQPEKRIPLLRRFVTEYADSPAALLGYRMLQRAYLQQNDYAQAVATGEEILRRDPRHFETQLRQVQAYLGQDDLENALAATEDAKELVQAAEPMPPPEDASPDAWEEKKAQSLQQARAELQRLSYDLYLAATEVQQPAQQEALLRHYVELFPQSLYLASAYFSLAVAAQQQGNLQRAVRWGRQGLQVEPDNGMLIVLVADLLSDRGQDLTQARDLADRLLGALQNDPESVRPAGYADAQWAEQKKVWEGLAHSIRGQVFLHWGATDPPDRPRLARAIEEFNAASPLLRADKMSYARNFFRLGFAHAKLGEYPQAREALNQAIALGTPYTQPAQDLLGRLQR